MAGAMSGKVCLVTGATSGIGKAWATALAQAGARVFIAARGSPRADAALAEIRAAAPGADVSFLAADLTSIASTQALAKALAEKTDKLHVLVNNAGGTFPTRKVSPDGVEVTLALNVIAPLVLTEALKPLLVAAHGARVIHLATKLPPGTKFHLEDLNREKGYSGFGVYAEAKLAVIALATWQAEQFAGTGVTVNSFHPGIVLGTEFGSEGSAFGRKVFPVIAKLFGMTTPLDVTIANAMAVASKPELASETGRYFIDGKPAALPAPAADPAQRAKLVTALRRWAPQPQA